MLRQGLDFHFEISEVEITRVNCSKVIYLQTGQICTGRRKKEQTMVIQTPHMKLLTHPRTKTMRNLTLTSDAAPNNMSHYENSLSNILKILQPKKENFQIKNSDIFHISAQNIDCGYSLELPRYIHKLCCFNKIRKIMYIPVNPSFTI